MLELMEANVKLNNLESRLEVKELNWYVLRFLPTVSLSSAHTSTISPPRLTGVSRPGR